MQRLSLNRHPVQGGLSHAHVRETVTLDELADSARWFLRLSPVKLRAVERRCKQLRRELLRSIWLACHEDAA